MSGLVITAPFFYLDSIKPITLRRKKGFTDNGPAYTKAFCQFNFFRDGITHFQLSVLEQLNKFGFHFIYR